MERWFKNGEMISHIEGIFKKWRDEPNGEIDTKNQQYDVLKVFFKKGRDVNGELKNLCPIPLWSAQSIGLDWFMKKKPKETIVFRCVRQERISIRGCVRPSVRPSVRRSVRRSVGHTRVEIMK